MSLNLSENTGKPADTSEKTSTAGNLQRIHQLHTTSQNILKYEN